MVMLIFIIQLSVVKSKRSVEGIYLQHRGNDFLYVPWILKRIITRTNKRDRILKNLQHFYSTYFFLLYLYETFGIDLLNCDRAKNKQIFINFEMGGGMLPVYFWKRGLFFHWKKAVILIIFNLSILQWLGLSLCHSVSMFVIIFWADLLNNNSEV